MLRIKRASLVTLIALLLALLPANAQSTPFPETIPLPTGFRPEGIALGHGSTFYAGSLADGAILRGDLRTGQTRILVSGLSGMLTVGLRFDDRSSYLFAAGGPTGLARVFDAGTGELLATYQLASPGNFINDVIVTREAAYFTNSSQALLYRVPLGPGGSLPDPSDIQTLTLSGDWVQSAGFNANGIEATSNGKYLVIVNSTAGMLFRVDPLTGEAVAIDLGGESVSAGDGLLFYGSLLYVVRNQLNLVVVIDLSADLTSGVVVDRITDPALIVPTTLVGFGNALYLVNAKFGVPSPATIPYEIVRVPLH